METSPHGWLPVVSVYAEMAIVLLLLPVLFLLFRTLQQAKQGARQAQLAAEQAKRAAEAHFISLFLEEFSIPQMQDSIALMTEWRDSWPAEARRAWLSCDENAASNHWGEIEHVYSDQVREAQTRLERYFNRAWQLSRSGYLSNEAMTIISDPVAYALLFDIVQPLTNLDRYRLNGAASDIDPSWYDDMRKRFGDGNARLSR